MSTKSLHEQREARHGAMKTAEVKAPHKTLNDLPQDIREQMIDLCNARVADCTDLAGQIKVAHWNVRGPQFIALHKLFDEIYEDLSEHTDTIAERVSQLGGMVKGTIRIAAKQSTLDEYPVDIFTCEDHVREASKRLAAFGKLCREAMDTAEEAQDIDTVDLFTEVSRAVDKWLWFVEAHQHADR